MENTKQSMLDKMDIEISGEKIYFSAFLFYFVAMFLGTTTYTQYISLHLLNYISYISLGLLFFKIFLFDKLSRMEVVVYVLSVSVSLMTWLETNSILGFASMMFILGAKGIKLTKIIEWYFNLGTIMLIFVVISSQIGVIQNLTYERSGIFRQAFGIIYPTDFASHVFYLLLAYSYLNFGRLKFKSFLAFFGTGILVILLCDARLSAICIILMIPVLYLAQSAQNGGNLTRKLMSLSWILVPTLTFLVVMASVFFDAKNRIFIFFNNLFSDRLALSHIGFNRYGFSLLGKPITEHGWGGTKGLKSYHGLTENFHYFMLDSSIVRIFILYGTIFALLLFTLVAIKMLKEAFEKQYGLIACLMLVIIAGVVEQHFLELVYNPFLIGIVAITTEKSKGIFERW